MPAARESYALGDVVSTMIRTAAGQTILVVHDTNSPRPYSRKILLQGTRGIVRKYPEQKIHVEGRSEAHRWDDLATYRDEFEHPVWRALEERSRGAGHGGMDFIEDYRLVQCLRSGQPLDYDVYDGAAWSAVSALSERSIASRSRSLDFPGLHARRLEDPPAARHRGGVMGVLVEVTVDSVESARAAEAGGAARVELCAGLVEGGTTPSAGSIAACREALSIPLYVIIRPRGGDFLYGPAELDVMRRNILHVKEMGAAGVVLGALRRDASVDVEGVRDLVEAARPLGVTFHRAMDFTRDPAEALEALMGLGVERVLTSGGAASALEGIPTLAELVRQAGDRITIVAAGGISGDNVGHIVQATEVREVHVRAAARRDSAVTYRRAGLSLTHAVPGQYAWYETDAELVRLVVDALAE